MEYSVLEQLPDNLAEVLVVIPYLSYLKVEAVYHDENQVFIITQSGLKVSASLADTWEEL
jgi:hypothetical protein